MNCAHVDDENKEKGAVCHLLSNQLALVESNTADIRANVLHFGVQFKNTAEVFEVCAKILCHGGFSTPLKFEGVQFYVGSICGFHSRYSYKTYFKEQDNSKNILEDLEKGRHPYLVNLFNSYVSSDTIFDFLFRQLL